MFINNMIPQPSMAEGAVPEADINMFDIDFEDFDFSTEQPTNGGSKSSGDAGFPWSMNDGGDVMLSHGIPNENGLDYRQSGFSEHFNVPNRRLDDDNTLADWSSYLSPVDAPPSSIFEGLQDPNSPLYPVGPYSSHLTDMEPLFLASHLSNVSTPADDPLPITPVTESQRNPAIRTTSYDTSSLFAGMDQLPPDLSSASFFPSKVYSKLPTSSLAGPPITANALASIPPSVITSPVLSTLPAQVVSPRVMGLTTVPNTATSSPVPLPFRPPPSARAPIDIDAPTQARSYLTPSATSRRQMPAFIDKAASRKMTREQLEAVKTSDTALPNEIANAIDKKRRANCVSARKLRRKKQEHVLELEQLVMTLRSEVEMYKGRAENAQVQLKMLDQLDGVSF